MPLAVAEPEPGAVCMQCNPFVLGVPVPPAIIAQVYGSLKVSRPQVPPAPASSSSSSSIFWCVTSPMELFLTRKDRGSRRVEASTPSISGRELS